MTSHHHGHQHHSDQYPVRPVAKLVSAALIVYLALLLILVLGIAGHKTSQLRSQLTVMENLTRAQDEETAKLFGLVAERDVTIRGLLSERASVYDALNHANHALLYKHPAAKNPLVCVARSSDPDGLEHAAHDPQ